MALEESSMGGRATIRRWWRKKYRCGRRPTGQRAGEGGWVGPVATNGGTGVRTRARTLLADRPVVRGGQDSRAAEGAGDVRHDRR